MGIRKLMKLMMEEKCSRGEWLTLDQARYRSQSTKTKVTTDLAEKQPIINGAPFSFGPLRATVDDQASFLQL
jgi:hypothetical protein